MPNLTRCELDICQMSIICQLLTVDPQVTTKSSPVFML
jgi:hypothetical protein